MSENSFFSWPSLLGSQNGTQTTSPDGLSQISTNSGSSDSCGPGLSEPQFSALLDMIDSTINNSVTTTSSEKIVGHGEDGPFDYLGMTKDIMSTPPPPQDDQSRYLDLNSPSSSTSGNQHVSVEKCSKIIEQLKAQKKMIELLKKHVELYQPKTMDFVAGSTALASMTNEPEDLPLPEVFENFTSGNPGTALRTTDTSSSSEENLNSVPIPEPEDLVLRDLPDLNMPFAHSVQCYVSLAPSSSSSSSTDWESPDDQSQPLSQVF